ncbi:MAG: squalene/phytoene synthase family protein [Inquilinaceae bacterium]
MGLAQTAAAMLETTSRTFFIPIMGLPEPLRSAVASAYLAFRAIDEIEDDTGQPAAPRSAALRRIAGAVEAAAGDPDLGPAFAGLESPPDVTRRLSEWLTLAPPDVRPRIADAVGAMADRMAYWVDRDFAVSTRDDFDRYTYAVAGAVGLLLCDLWAWHDGTVSDRRHAIGYGRGLQAVNILRNRDEDLARGVDFWPDGWDRSRMIAYCRDQLAQGDAYIAALPAGPALGFCRLPLALAHGTLGAIEDGRGKLSRVEVMTIAANAQGVRAAR